jgi:mycoredoxin-dependent peroxiredoxin
VNIGEVAPDFTLRDQHGAEVRLGAFHSSPDASGEARNVVLVFYPYAFTGVCTSELAALGKRLAEFEALSASVVAVSCDSMYSQRVFAEREGLTFPLLSDFWPHGAVASAYGVFDAERGCALRGTFVIDRTGAVRWQVVNQLPDARDPEEYLAVLKGL